MKKSQTLAEQVRERVKDASGIRVTIDVADGHPVLLRDIARYSTALSNLLRTNAKQAGCPEIDYELISLQRIGNKVAIHLEAVVVPTDHRCPCGRVFKTAQGLGSHFNHCARREASP